MPTFLDDFAYLVNSKKESMREKIFKGKPSPLGEVFRRYVDSVWVSLSDLEEFSVNTGQLDVLAVDSSVYTNLLSTGGVFYIVRSMAVQKDVVCKKLETDVIFSKDRMRRIRELITAKMELLEFEVALEALRKGFNGDAILLDGSLYGRAAHVPIETRVEEERDVLLRYFQVYKELLDLCNKSNVPVVGVSKESRSTFYRDYLLSLMFDEKLEELDVDVDDKKKLRDVFFEVLDRERVAFERFSKLKERYGNKLETVELILEELACSRPDYQLIINFAATVGYTQPLLLGPTIRMARRLKEYKGNPRKWVRNHFPHLTREKGDDFVNWASQVVGSIVDFPSFISFYILLDPKDSPIRIDMPYYGKSMLEVGWPETVKADVGDLLRIMVTGYCGLNAYNLWLKNVDEKVRLRRRVVDGIYVPYLEKLFKEKIIRSRGYRRVKYP